MKTVYVASDHAGFELKQFILKNFSLDGFILKDFGPSTSDRVDYPDFADEVCEAVSRSSTDSSGLLICGSGQGMAIRANKYGPIRAALCWNEEIVQLSRGHNNANVLCLGSRFVSHHEALEFLKLFLTTPFQGGRHAIRVEKIHQPLKA